MMRRISTVRTIFVLFFVGCAACFAQSSGKVEPEKIPIPPQQNKPWTPPATSLPPVVVSAIADLFKEGLADPRGCEFREVKIWNWNTLGWVLPGEGKKRYAIALNGKIYPVVSVGPLVDQQKEPSLLRYGGFMGDHFQEQYLQDTSLLTSNPMPLKAALLFRGGEVKAAEQMLTIGYGGADRLKDKDPYIDMITVWLDLWQNQAVGAYLHGDYASALSICKSLSAALKRVEDTAAARGIANPWPNEYYTDFFWQLPILEADVNRRLTEKPHLSVLENGLPPEGPERIAALIRDLDTVNVRQTFNPGMTEVSDDPVVQALIHEGDTAVEPLLKCLVEDNRLTRTQFTADMGCVGPVIPVYEAAYTALFAILKMPEPYLEHVIYNGDARKFGFFHMSLEDRKALASQLRATWQKDKPMPPAERAFFILQDDKAGSDAWLAAVDEIMKSAEPSPRNWKYPSVSDLIAGRFNELVHDNTDTNIDQGKLGDLIMDVATLDGKNHLNDLKGMGRGLNARFLDQHSESLLAFNTSLWEKRLELGDATALGDDYPCYLLAATINAVNDVANGERGGKPLPAEDFRLMWMHPDDPAIRRAADIMFTDNVPGWQKYIEKNNGSDTDILPSPLLGLPAFRRLVDTALSNTNVIGSLINTNAGTETISFNDATNHAVSSVGSTTSSKAPVPTAAAPESFRMCDYFAHRLSAVKGFPPCELSWLQDQRDQAVAACRAFLQKYGDDLKYRPGDPDFQGRPDTVAHLHFPQLHHPATPDDVNAGRAIFSLDGSPRIVPLPSFPVPAIWTANKEHQEGVVWQAEETEVNGKWERYYGFYGTSNFFKAPAAEIAFPSGGTQTGLAGISATLSGPVPQNIADTPSRELFARFGSPNERVPFADPLPLTLTIRNDSGFDQKVPEALVLPAGATNTFSKGISISVSYSPKLLPLIRRLTDPDVDLGPFHELPLRNKIVVNTVHETGPTLLPTETLTLLKIDLRDYFPMDHAGSYRVSTFFHLPGQPATQTGAFSFSLDHPAASGEPTAPQK